MIYKYLILILISISTLPAFAKEANFPRHPSVSPNGDVIAFSYGGDLWTVPIEGGRASRLTVSSAYEHSPRWSPDGEWIAFSANRCGNDDVYIIPSSGGQSKQLTFHESDDQVCSWAPDAGSVIFHSRRDDRYPDKPILYCVPIEGGTPFAIMKSFGTDGVISSDGRKMLYTRSGKNTSWWRRHYKGSASPQIWIYDFENDKHIVLTDTGQHKTGEDYRRPPSRWSFWGSDGSIFVTSEQDGTPNIYKRLSDNRWENITNYTEDGVRFPSISANGRIITYEHKLGIYVIENEGESRKLNIIAPLDNPKSTKEKIKYTNKAERLTFSPDGQQMFIEVRGEIFAGRVVDDDDKAARGRANSITRDNPAREGDFTVSPGGDSLIFVSDRNGNRNLYIAYSSNDETPELARTFDVSIEQLTDNSADEYRPQWSPDGSSIAYRRGKGDLVIRNLKSGKEFELLKGWSLLQYAWSPDGKWIAFAREDNDYNSDVFIIPAEGHAEINISRHPDEDTFPVWSADGRKLAFRSRRKENNWNLHFVFLREEDHYKSTADWAEEERQSKSKKKDKDDKEKKDKDKKKKDEDKSLIEVVIDTTEIFRRIRRVACIANEDSDIAISLDGKKFAYVDDYNGKRDLYIADWTSENKKRLTKDGEKPKFISFTEDGKRIRYLTGSGKVKSIGIEGKKSKSHPFDARVTVNWQAERRQKFGEIWRTLNDRFYHPDFHGYNWAAIRDKYQSQIDAASCERDFGDLMDMMIGELNSSHSGYWSPSFGHSYSTGRLGLDFVPSRLDTPVRQKDLPGLLIKYVQPKGPCDRIKEPIEVGERLIAVNGTKLDHEVNLHELLRDQVGQRVELVLAKGKKERRVVVRPMGAYIQGALRYDEWVKDKREMVDSLSDGELGYLHLRGMGNPSLARFEAQLYSMANGKDGLVIDVRNNGGGWTTDYVLAMLQVRRHAVTFPRDGGPGYPQGRLPLYSWVKPIIVLCNEYSFSNAEIFSHSIKTLGRGKLVGVPTPGGVISTGGHRLLDGSGFRLPLRGWYTGKEPSRDPRRNMEGNGAVPDIIVPLIPGQMINGEDEQLETAVKELLQEVNTGVNH
ncbi:MAG: S41 family peptidase [Candidatus Hatepunaea meridiana]|nr:S41 family peptidase [Candidatus Hatepunaea meridiana]